MPALATIPEQNIEILICLYEVEVGLRELIVDELSLKFGSLWWKDRLDKDALDDYKDHQAKERRTHWMQLVSHHPIYYTNFSTLSRTILRKDNWRDCFRIIFRDEKQFAVTLSELEPIRNKVAHNRRCTDMDVRAVIHSAEKLENMVGLARFADLCSRSTHDTNLHLSIQELEREATKALEDCRAFKPLARLPIWEQVEGSWWFDKDYLGVELVAISRLMETLGEYIGLPRARGSIDVIEEWIMNRDVDNLWDQASSEFRLLIIGQGGSNVSGLQRNVQSV